MNFLTHLCLPLAVAYALDERAIPSPVFLSLGVFGLVPDFDKFLGVPGLLHSLVTIVPLCLLLLAAEWRLRGRLRLSPLVSGLIASHLVLDFIGGGPIPLLFPLTDVGVGLRYPAQAAFGEGILGLQIQGPLVTIATSAPQPGFNTYGFIDGTGVTSLLILAILYSRDSRWSLRPGRRASAETTPSGSSSNTERSSDGD